MIVRFYDDQCVGAQGEWRGSVALMVRVNERIEDFILRPEELAKAAASADPVVVVCEMLAKKLMGVRGAIEDRRASGVIPRVCRANRVKDSRRMTEQKDLERIRKGAK